MALKAFPRVKVRKDYNGKVVAIKKKLSGYDDASFITMMYDHFQTILKNQNLGFLLISHGVAS
ncbi:hypothetical protein RKK42_25245 [Klebsiella pneumoniae]|nr:hypothetical protein [Klebsiella pneumoniae]